MDPEKIIGTKNERDLKTLRPLVEKVNAIEETYQSLTEAELKAKTLEFKERVAKGETLDHIMCEAFAAVKNACRRLVGTRFDVCGHEVRWDMVPFDVQVMGGIVLHQGKIAEMATGEGKTLVATMPLYLNALAGQNVHLVTVNDYLARRDAQWMGAVYEYLGLTVGCIQNHMDSKARRAEYGKDITYGTNSEFGFDYLRDNGMAWHPEDQVQRGYHYAIVDEIDSILIDEARTPLIISGPVPLATHQFNELKPRVERLVRKQRDLCNGLLQEAKEALEKGDTATAESRLYQVRHGMPKNKQLMHMIEDPDVRRILEKIQASLLTDMRKEYARELREELYFNIDEKGHDASLTEKGCEEMSPSDPEAYVLPDLVSAMSDLDGESGMSAADKAARIQQIQTVFAERSERIHSVDQLIRAYTLYERDVDYVVQTNQVLIVDEYTGRILPGRRWSDGLHQAVEAKEGVKIEGETQTLATITIQNYFRMYKKLAGMTGTAETEADEFHQVYHLDVVVMATNRPVRRVDFNDMVFKTQREKYKAIIDEITDCNRRGQPVLVGTISVEASELLSRMLRRANITHNVLNAKNHEREADIVIRAGQAGSVTIATNMAGRGTDIKLGEGVVYLDRNLIESQTRLEDRADGKTLRAVLTEKPCGLHVMGSERHESRRIDRQLRGRCARQGDPGSSRFYVSLEDDLMRLFGSDRISGIMERLGLEEGQVLEHRWLNRSIETAQRRVEQQNFSHRKRTLEYDDVMNKQREIIYGFRGAVVAAPNVREHLYDVIEDVVRRRAEEMVATGNADTVQAFVSWIQTTFPVIVGAEDIQKESLDADGITARIFERVKRAYELKAQTENPDETNMLERYVILSAIDTHWQDYLRSMDSLRQGVGLRAYGQRDPLVEYKREAFDMFSNLLDQIREDISSKIFRSSISARAFESFLSALPKTTIHEQVSALGHGGVAAGGSAETPMPSDGVVEEAIRAAAEPVRRQIAKVGRNDPCPCGSGKKYKKCCGA